MAINLCTSDSNKQATRRHLTGINLHPRNVYPGIANNGLRIHVL